MLISETVEVPEGPRQGSGLRRRAFLRRLHRQSATSRCARSKPRRRPAPTCSACATPTAARSPAQLAEIVAEVRKRFDGVIGIHTHNDSDVAVANALAAVEAGRDARAGLHERLRRALRQRQPLLDHRQPGAEARPHHHRPGEADQPDLGVRASSPSWPICRCATTSRSSARAPSRTRAACTSAPC